jgi:predicted amidohydrolase YtcJ
MKSRAIISLLATLIATTACQPAVVTEPVDLVLSNGYVYTVDGSRSVAQAIAIKGDRIVFVGSNEAVADYVGEGTEVRDLGGAMVMPGLHDMHIHAIGIVEPDQ